MIERYLSQSKLFYVFFHCLLVVFAAVCFGVAVNFFYIPADIYSGGILGFAQLVAYVIDQQFPNLQAQTGTLNFIFNIPLIILALTQLGRRFTIMTVAVILLTSIFSNIIPTVTVSANPLLNGMVGGVLGGSAVGVAVRYGMSTGGLDILSIFLNRKTGLNVGTLSLIMNGILLVAIALVYHQWELALYTMISMYVNSRVVNYINNSDQRLTAFIVTENVEDVVSSLHQHIRRGFTVLDGRGGYKRLPRKVIMMVINRYELFELQHAVKMADPRAFVNIVRSQYVSGNYLSRHQQEMFRIREEQQTKT